MAPRPKWRHGDQMAALEWGGLLLDGRSGGFMLGLMVRRVMFSRVVIVIYLVVGLVVANSHHYFAHLRGAKRILSAVLAVVLWPLVLFEINLHIK